MTFKQSLFSSAIVFYTGVLCAAVPLSAHGADEPAVACPSKEECAVLLAPAKEGNAEAQFLLGNLFYFGLYPSATPGPQSQEHREEGMRWWRMSAEQGYKNSIVQLKVLHEAAPWTGDDGKAVVEWWKRIAEKGDPTAQEFLGAIFSEGKFGMKKDPAEAVSWWKKSAAQGNSTSQLALYTAYCKGAGVKKDKAEADKWFNEGYWSFKSSRKEPIGISTFPIKSGCNVGYVS